MSGMNLFKYTIKSMRGAWRTNLIFALLLALVSGVWCAVSTQASRASAELEALASEYGCSYELNTLAGTPILREDCERVRECPYVRDIEYRACRHFIYPANLTLTTGGKTLDIGEPLLILGQSEYSADVKLIKGALPSAEDECVLERSFFPDMKIGDTLTVTDGAADKERSYRVVGLIERDECEALLESRDFTGAVLITTLDGAVELEAEGQTGYAVFDSLPQGLDARVILNDYRDGDAFCRWVEDNTEGTRPLTARNPNGAYTDAAARLDDMQGMTELLRRALTAVGALTIILFVLIRTNLRAKEFCILFGMGAKLRSVALSAVLEYTSVVALGMGAGLIISFAFGGKGSAALPYCGAVALLCALLAAAATPLNFRKSALKILRRNNEHD